jgi:hypothetical protein
MLFGIFSRSIAFYHEQCLCSSPLPNTCFISFNLTTYKLQAGSSGGATPPHTQFCSNYAQLYLYFINMSNLLYIPTRRTQQISISEGIKECISSEYKQHPDRYLKELETIGSLRDSIVDCPLELGSLDLLFQ